MMLRATEAVWCTHAAVHARTGAHTFYTAAMHGPPRCSRALRTHAQARTPPTTTPHTPHTPERDTAWPPPPPKQQIRVTQTERGWKSTTNVHATAGAPHTEVTLFDVRRLQPMQTTTRASAPRNNTCIGHVTSTRVRLRASATTQHHGGHSRPRPPPTGLLTACLPAA